MFAKQRSIRVERDNIWAINAPVLSRLPLAGITEDRKYGHTILP